MAAPLRIQNEAGETLNAAVILPGLTGNATPDLFRNVFAFSLDELQVAASLNDSSGAIYSAGQGAPGLPALTKSLGDQKGLIYLSRGNVQKVPTLLKGPSDGRHAATLYRRERGPLRGPHNAQGRDRG